MCGSGGHYIWARSAGRGGGAAGGMAGVVVFPCPSEREEQDTVESVLEAELALLACGCPPQRMVVPQRPTIAGPQWKPTGFFATGTATAVVQPRGGDELKRSGIAGSDGWTRHAVVSARRVDVVRGGNCFILRGRLLKLLYSPHRPEHMVPTHCVYPHWYMCPA